MNREGILIRLMTSEVRAILLFDPFLEIGTKDSAKSAKPPLKPVVLSSEVTAKMTKWGPREKDSAEPARFRKETR